MTDLIPVLKELMTYILGPPNISEPEIPPGLFILTKSSSVLMHAVLRRSKEALHKFKGGILPDNQTQEIKTETPEENAAGGLNNLLIGEVVSLTDSTAGLKLETYSDKQSAHSDNNGNALETNVHTKLILSNSSKVMKESPRCKDSSVDRVRVSRRKRTQVNKTKTMSTSYSPNDELYRFGQFLCLNIRQHLVYLWSLNPDKGFCSLMEIRT